MTGIKEGEIKVLSENDDSQAFCSVKVDRSALSELAKHSSVCLSFGISAIFSNIKTKPSEGPFKKLLVSSEILQQLSVPYNKNIQVLVRQKNIIFGPLIGVFVSNWETENLAQGICKNKNFYKYIRTCKELNAIYCFFSLEDILWEHRQVKGWMLQEDALDEKWVSRILPIPTVIYDRCFGASGKTDGYELRSRLADIPEVTVFNAMPKLRKWETYEILRTYSDIRDCLPKTMPHSDPEKLKKLLRKPGRVYLKPDGLSKGTGIYTIGCSPSGGFTIRHRGPKANEVFKIDSLKKLDELFEPYFERGGGYIIQEEIPLARYKGRKFDMRVLCQKDINGTWIIGGIAVRVAAPRSIITSPRSGGRVVSLPQALKTVFNQDEDVPGGIASKITNTAFRICRIIEQHYGCCGELGLDMGIDAQGKVWVIEVNAKPLKVSLKRLLDQNLIQQVHANPIRFAYFLASKSYPGVD